jgi:cohesin loading factor subunit SCC2
LSAALLGQELATALQQLQRWIDAPDDDGDYDDDDDKDDLDTIKGKRKGGGRDREKVLVFAKKIRGALRDVWKEVPTDVFNTG